MDRADLVIASPRALQATMSEIPNSTASTQPAISTLTAVTFALTKTTYLPPQDLWILVLIHTVGSGGSVIFAILKRFDATAKTRAIAARAHLCNAYEQDRSAAHGASDGHGCKATRAGLDPTPAVSRSRGGPVHPTHDGPHDTSTLAPISRSPHAPVNVPVTQAGHLTSPVTTQNNHNEESRIRQSVISGPTHPELALQYPSGHENSKTKSFGSPKFNQSPIAAGYEAQAYIQKELVQNDRLGGLECGILQVAIDSIPGYSRSVQSDAIDIEESISEGRDLYDPSMYPSDEVVCFLSTGSQTIAGAFYSELTSFISRSTFEHMAYTLIDGQIRGYTRAEYLVCVNFFMLTSVGLEEADQSNLIKERLRLLRERYRNNAFAALRRIGVLSPPSLTLLQALLAGAMLFQMAGNVDKCAQLSASACLVCTQLGGRYFAELAASTSKQDSLEVRQCLGHCYMIDKSLAMSLGRRSHLPEMEVNATMLMPAILEMPSAPISNIYLEFAKVQDEIAREMRAQQSGSAEQAATNVVQTLRSRMEGVRVKSFEYRSQPPQCTDQLLQGEWMGVDFTYFSIMTAITRLHPSFHKDEHVREFCLEDARRSLFALRDMERHGLDSHKVWNAYCLSITWVVLLCPLCPFFALFCHIIETSNSSDLRLFEDVTQGLAVFENLNLSIANVRHLLNTLVSLCRERLDNFEGIEDVIADR